MARDYGSKRPSRQRRSGPHQLLVIAVTFLLGYLTATVCDVETVSHWLNSQVLAHQDSRPVPAKTETQHAQTPPKPKFEFYTLLANEKGATQPNTGAVANRATNVPTAKPVQITPSATGSKALASAVTNAARPGVLNAKQAAVKVAAGKPLQPASAAKGAYSVQVASFKMRQDAEHMKGLLILKGFNVTVVPIVHGGGNWYRVVVGPYPNRDLAQKAQVTLARTERLNGMVTGVRG